MLLFRRFGATRAFVLVGLLNFLRRRFGRRKPPPGVYEPGGTTQVQTSERQAEANQGAVYQPSQGSSQTVQRRPR